MTEAVDLPPADLADLPLVKFDFSCNKVSTIPVCYMKMKQLQSLQLENNPLQSPPAQVEKPRRIEPTCDRAVTRALLSLQICIKGKVHIFKYLSIEACRSEKMPDALYLPVIERLSLSRPSNGRSVKVTLSSTGMRLLKTQGARSDSSSVLDLCPSFLGFSDWSQI